MGCHCLLRGIFPTQGLNPGLPHCRQTLYHLSQQGKFFKIKKEEGGMCCWLSWAGPMGGHALPSSGDPWQDTGAFWEAGDPAVGITRWLSSTRVCACSVSRAAGAGQMKDTALRAVLCLDSHPCRPPDAQHVGPWSRALVLCGWFFLRRARRTQMHTGMTA